MNTVDSVAASDSGKHLGTGRRPLARRERHLPGAGAGNTWSGTLRGELIRFRSIRSTWIGVGVFLVGSGLSPLLAVVMPSFIPILLESASADQKKGMAPILAGMKLEAGTYQENVLDLSGSTFSQGVGLTMIGVFTLSLMLATTDLRFNTVLATLSAGATRGDLVGAKAAALALVVAPMALVMAFVAVVVLAVALAVTETPWEIGVGTVAAMVARQVVGMVLLALFVLGLGLALAGQVRAVVALVVFALVEQVLRALPMLMHFDKTWLDWLPLGLVQSANATWSPAVVLLVQAAWAGVFLVAGWWRWQKLPL